MGRNNHEGNCARHVGLKKQQHRTSDLDKVTKAVQRTILKFFCFVYLSHPTIKYLPIHTHTHTHTHACIYTHTHTHTHTLTCMQTNLSVPPPQKKKIFFFFLLELSLSHVHGDPLFLTPKKEETQDKNKTTKNCLPVLPHITPFC